MYFDPRGNIGDVTSQRFVGAQMDRSTKATLWIAFIVLSGYFVWFFLDCAMDDACHLVCRFGGRGGCYTQRTPELKSP
jgi:hypothetical protein